jgi:hypothetical protein
MRLEMNRRGLGYILFTVAMAMLTVAWLKSFPLLLPVRNSYLYNLIYPSFWLSLSLVNISLFLIASNSDRSWERFACGFIFFLLTFSLLFFFTFMAGSDSNTFRGLTEDYALTGGLLPEVHSYYQWPALFILGSTVAELMGVSATIASEILFATWTLVLTGGLFLYTIQRNNVEDFLSIVVYVIAVFPFFNWQYAAQTFALTLFALCIILIRRTDSASRVITMFVYVALVFSHAFFAVFLVIAEFVLALKNRRHAGFAVFLGLFYVLYVVFESTFFFRDTVALISVALLAEYSSVVGGVLTQPYSSLDAMAQLLNRVVTLSIWVLLGTIIVFLAISRKLRNIDISVAASGLAYGLIGAVVSVLGWRALQVAALPSSYAIRAFSPSPRLRKILLVYFVLILAVFPLGTIHYYYNYTNYVTLAEQHAVSVVSIAAAEHGGQTDIRVLIRGVVGGFVESKTDTNTYYVTEISPTVLLMSARWFQLVFVSPELWHSLTEAGLSPAELSVLEKSMIPLSRVYSNGHVVVLFNTNATAPPEVGS